ncbi:MAG: hypothetical protein JW874_13850, partial [Spirochaetales bacterium]|nr:hypothetical protein [Spirochaetales bacterium]
MKKLIFAVFIAIAALIFSGCPADVAGTTLDDTVLDQSQEDNLDAAIGADSITLDNITLDTDGVAEFRVDQPEDIIVTMTFNGVIIDEDTVATGIIFYNLGDTADTDGAYHREEVLEYESVVVEFDQWADATDVIFTFNIPDGTDTGSLIEYFIDPTVLTGNNGLARMDYDGDQVPAEAQDDDYIGYITVADAGYTADGASRQPRGIFPIAVGTDIILDTDQIDISVASIFAPVTVLTTLAELDETIDLELFDPVTGTWSVINASTTLDNVNGIYTLEIPVDADAGQIYRYILHDPYDLQESATVRGYRHRLSYDQNQEWEWRNLG